MCAHDRDDRSWASYTCSEVRTLRVTGLRCLLTIVMLDRERPRFLEDTNTWSHELEAYAHYRDDGSWAFQTVSEEKPSYDHELRSLGHDREHGPWTTQSCQLWQAMLTKEWVPIVSSFIAVVRTVSRSWARVVTSLLQAIFFYSFDVEACIHGLIY